MQLPGISSEKTNLLNLPYNICKKSTNQDNGEINKYLIFQMCPYILYLVLFVTFC